MATRLYLEEAPGGTPAAQLLEIQPSITPAFDAGWTVTANAARRYLTTRATRRYTATPGFTRAGTAVNPTTTGHRQFISRPLSGDQTIAGTVKGMIMMAETNLTDNYVIACVMRVLSGDGGTVRGTLLTDLASAGSEFATAQASVKIPGGWTGAGASLSSVNAKNGDILVIEIGFRQTSTSTANATLRYGSGSGSTSVEYNETEGDTDATHVPWIEFSQDLFFYDSLVGDPDLDWDELSSFIGQGPDPMGVYENPPVQFVIVVAGTPWEVTVDDTVSLADALAFVQEKVIADSVTPTDALTFERDIHPADTVSLADALSFERDIHIVESALSLSDNIVAGLAFQVTVDDTLSLADSLLTETGKGVNIDDTLSLADSLSFERDIHLTDSVTPSDALSFDRQMALADSLGIADALSFARDVHLVDTLSLADAIAFARDIHIDEALSVADSVLTELGGVAAVVARLRMMRGMGL